MSLKQLWQSRIPYGDGIISHEREMEFVKKHGPILLAGVTTVLFHNIKWLRKFVKIGVWAVSRPEEIERVEEPRQLPPPKQQPESQL